MRTFLRVWLSISAFAIAFGIVIIILAFASGGAYWKDVETYSVNESYDNVSKIDFNIPYGEVNIQVGDTFSVDAKNLVQDDFQSYVTDGTWYIEENATDKFSIFGIRLSLRQLCNWNNEFTPKITITIPEGFVAEDFNLQVGAGDVKADSISSVKGYFNVDAGRLSINQLSITDKSQYSVGAGEMVLQDVAINDITLDCGVGNILIDGVVTGNNDISCGVGGVELDINGKDSDYSYDISSGIGNVEIDGNKYHNLNESTNNEAVNKLTLDCGIGNITVDFN